MGYANLAPSAGDLHETVCRLRPLHSTPQSSRQIQIAGDCLAVAVRSPVLASMAGDIHRKFQPAPNAQFVEDAAQMILDDLLAGSHDLADFAIGQPLPDQGCDVGFLGSKLLSWHHDLTSSSLVNMAMASFTRLRPSRMPARRNSVRRCCFTVRGLICNWPAISLLLHPWTSRLKTC